MHPPPFPWFIQTQGSKENDPLFAFLKIFGERRRRRRRCLAAVLAYAEGLGGLDAAESSWWTKGA